MVQHGTAPYALQRLVWTGKTPFEMKHPGTSGWI
jgi:hypothetical protein